MSEQGDTPPVRCMTSDEIKEFRKDLFKKHVRGVFDELPKLKYLKIEVVYKDGGSKVIEHSGEMSEAVF